MPVKIAMNFVMNSSNSIHTPISPMRSLTTGNTPTTRLNTASRFNMNAVFVARGKSGG